MKLETLKRMRGVLDTVKTAQLARLGKATADAAHARAEAARHRHEMHAMQAVGDTAGMIAQAGWQARLRTRAHEATARAEAAEAEAAQLRAALARDFGREQAVSRLLETAEREARTVAERRAEDDRPQPLPSSSTSGPGPSSTGIA